MILCANCRRNRATHKGLCWNCANYYHNHGRHRIDFETNFCDCDPSKKTPAVVWVEYRIEPHNRLSVSNGNMKAWLALCADCYAMWEEDEADTPYTIAWIGQAQNETNEMQALPT